MKKLNAHYGKNDPYRFSLDNNLNLIEGQLIKYITRHRKGEPTPDKFGLRDLLAAQGALDRLIIEWKLNNEATTVIDPPGYKRIPPTYEEQYTDSFTKLVPPTIAESV